MGFSFWRKKSREQELDEELASHLQMAAQDRAARGESPQDAKYSARHEFGNPELVKESTRDAWGWRWLHDFSEDLRFGLRMCSKNPGFASVVVLTLALGIGASTAVFSLVNAVLLRALPYGEADRLVYLYTPNPRFPNVPATEFTPTNADFLDIREESKSYARMTMFKDRSFNLSANGAAQRVRGAAADGNFFSTLRLSPQSDERLIRPMINRVTNTLHLSAMRCGAHYSVNSATFYPKLFSSTGKATKSLA